MMKKQQNKEEPARTPKEPCKMNKKKLRDSCKSGYKKTKEQFVNHHGVSSCRYVLEAEKKNRRIIKKISRKQAQKHKYDPANRYNSLQKQTPNDSTNTSPKDQKQVRVCVEIQLGTKETPVVL
jgi:hypothetical protein